MARGLKFWIKEVEGLYYLYSINKDADQLHGYHATDLYSLLVLHMKKAGFFMTYWFSSCIILFYYDQLFCLIYVKFYLVIF